MSKQVLCPPYLATADPATGIEPRAPRTLYNDLLLLGCDAITGRRFLALGGSATTEGGHGVDRPDHVRIEIGPGEADGEVECGAPDRAPVAGFWGWRSELAAGFEPTTCRLQGGCSTELSYASRTVRLPNPASGPAHRRPLRRRPTR